MSVTRFAISILTNYRDKAHMQDFAETLVGGGVASGGQPLFTDMSPEEITLSTG